MAALIWILVFIILIAMSTLIIKESERAVVYRNGKPNRVIGPGVCFVMPFLERAKRTDMNNLTTEWKSLSPEELMRLLVTHLSNHSK